MITFCFSDVIEPAGKDPLQVRARVFVRRTEEGGRVGPFTHDYRPNHNFGGPEDRVFFIGRLEVPDGAWVYPGDVRELTITFLNVRGLAELLQVGRKWRLQEGHKLVGTAEVLSVVRESWPSGPLQVPPSP